MSPVRSATDLELEIAEFHLLVVLRGEGVGGASTEHRPPGK